MKGKQGPKGETRIGTAILGVAIVVIASAVVLAGCGGSHREPTTESAAQVVTREQREIRECVQREDASDRSTMQIAAERAAASGHSGYAKMAHEDEAFMLEDQHEACELKVKQREQRNDP